MVASKQQELKWKKDEKRVFVQTECSNMVAPTKVTFFFEMVLEVIDTNGTTPPGFQPKWYMVQFDYCSLQPQQQSVKSVSKYFSIWFLIFASWLNSPKLTA
jgi:hypothetical protein